MSENKCTFCRVYQSRQGIIFENEFFFSRFDSFPVSPGHAEVIPKRHIVSLLDLTTEEWLDLRPAIQDTIGVIEATDFKKTYESFLQNPLNERQAEFCKKMLALRYLNRKPDGFNIGNNEGRAAGRTVDHLHIHIIPRHFGDVQDYVGGIRHIIPGMGNYKK